MTIPKGHFITKKQLIFFPDFALSSKIARSCWILATHYNHFNLFLDLHTYVHLHLDNNSSVVCPFFFNKIVLPFRKKKRIKKCQKNIATSNYTFKKNIATSNYTFKKNIHFKVDLYFTNNLKLNRFWKNKPHLCTQWTKSYPGLPK